MAAVGSSSAYLLAIRGSPMCLLFAATIRLVSAFSIWNMGRGTSRIDCQWAPTAADH